MKARLLVFVAGFILLLHGCSKENISGSAKISRIYANGQLQSEYSYNSLGLLQGHVMYGFPGRKMMEESFTYDGSGRLTKKETALDFSSGPNPVWSYSYTDYIYRSDGRVSAEINYLKQGSNYVVSSKAQPTYDPGGRMVTRRLLLPNDSLARLTTYNYDNIGNIILKEEYSYNNSVPHIEYRYSYDAFDNKVNPHAGMPNSAPPYSININNILRTTVTNFVLTPGAPSTNTNTTTYNSYNGKGWPVNMFENGTNFLYEYR